MVELQSWLNGSITSKPVVSGNNRGLLVGLGVFETAKVSVGHVEFLERHLNRLEQAWVKVGTGELDVDYVRRGISAVLKANSQFSDLARLRITVTLEEQSPTILITMTPMQPWPETTSCIVVPWVRNERSPLVGIKSTSYADNILSLQWAQNLGFAEGIYVNTVGELSEGTATNIFLVHGDRVLTPRIESGVLPGVVRQVLLDHNLASEGVLTMNDLESADEIFLTSSTRGVHPVALMGERQFPEIGPRTQSIMSACHLLDK